MYLIKICGITNLKDAIAAVECGADALGFNFYRASPRYVEPDEARAISLEVPPPVWKVGIFADEDADIVRRLSQHVALDFLQFHGNETPYYCEQFAVPYWKAFRLKDEGTLELMKKYQPDAYLVDAYLPGKLGGIGLVANWDLAARAKQFGKIILAGGLNPENIENAIATIEPWAVDVCSGVEAEPGIKDHKKMAEFIERVKGMGRCAKNQ